MNFPSIVSGIVLIALAGCAQQTREPAPPANHPANPQATSAPAPKMSSTLNPGDTDVAAAKSAPKSAAPAASGDAAAAATPAVPVVYTCPHHPKVMEADAGDCPFCGMKLVPTNSRNTSPVRGVEPGTPTPTTPGTGHEGHGK
jgi:hypothetical protein